MTEENLIIKYRNELFGVATLMIILCHSTSIVPFSSRISNLISYGTIGVYIFLFLSGIGLYYSFQNNNNVLQFYKKRFCRVMIPYIFIAGWWYGIKYLVFEKGNITYFIYELSMLSFWREHKGAWFVAAIIPIYILYPFLFRWLEKGSRYFKTSILIFFIMCIAFSVTYINKDLYNHLSQFFVGGVIFLVGNCVAESIKMNTFNGRWLFIIGIVLFGIKSVTSLKRNIFFCDISVGMMTISIMFILVFLINKCGKICKTMLVKIGAVSLESYLFNIFLLQAVKYWDDIFLVNSDKIYRIYLYTLIMVLGLLLAYLSQKIIKNVERVKCS